MLLGFQQRLRLHALVPSEVWYYNGSFVEFQSENKLQLGYTIVTQIVIQVANYREQLRRS